MGSEGRTEAISRRKRHLEQVRREQAERAAEAAERAARAKLVDPVKGWRNHITSRPGHRHSPGGVGSTNHKGLDIGVPHGTKIQAVKDGKVVFAGSHGKMGNLVVIKHNDGKFSMYAHQSALNVREGQSVKAGDVVGRVGSSGASTGAHLHFEVRAGSSNWKAAKAVDPVAYLDGAKPAALGHEGEAYAATSAGGSSRTSSGSNSGAGDNDWNMPDTRVFSRDDFAAFTLDFGLNWDILIALLKMQSMDVDAFLAANPGLKKGENIPKGTKIQLPDSMNKTAFIAGTLPAEMSSQLPQFEAPAGTATLSSVSIARDAGAPIKV